MCGLFGAIGHGWSVGIVRALAICNRERGTDSLGFFDCSGRCVKRACDPCDALRTTSVSRWLNVSAKGNDSHDSSWFLAGHTRFATRGVINRKNSHPFKFGDIIGSHNGIVDAPRRYPVDSMYLFDSLNKADGDYQSAWGDVIGYWGLTWFDGYAFYMQVHDNTLYVGMGDDDVLYYSSDKKHLGACIDSTGGAHRLAEGETLRFVNDNGKVTWEEVTKFVSCDIPYWEYRLGVSNAKST